MHVELGNLYAFVSVRYLPYLIAHPVGKAITRHVHTYHLTRTLLVCYKTTIL